MTTEEHKRYFELFKVQAPFEVFVIWHDGLITRETVLANDGNIYILDYTKHQSYYAPHHMCEVINKEFTNIIIPTLKLL